MSKHVINTKSSNLEMCLLTGNERGGGGTGILVGKVDGDDHTGVGILYA